MQENSLLKIAKTKQHQKARLQNNVYLIFHYQYLEPSQLRKLPSGNLANYKTNISDIQNS